MSAIRPAQGRLDAGIGAEPIIIEGERRLMARYKLISCEVFQRELCAAIATSPNAIDPEFLEIGLHDEPEVLRGRLQERIDAAGEGYDATLLGYGLCGNGLSGIRAGRSPLVVARAHDCCAILIGSRSAYEEHFGNCPSASWSSAGYIERSPNYLRTADEALGIDYEEIARKYGEENARYVREALKSRAPETEVRFIETEETAALGYAEVARERAAAEGKGFILIQGSSRLLRGLLSGGWDESEYLVVPPLSRIAPTYDREVVFEAED